MLAKALPPDLFPCSPLCLRACLHLPLSSPLAASSLMLPLTPLMALGLRLLGNKLCHVVLVPLLGCKLPGASIVFPAVFPVPVMEEGSEV